MDENQLSGEVKIHKAKGERFFVTSRVMREPTPTPAEIGPQGSNLERDFCHGFLKFL